MDNGNQPVTKTKTKTKTKTAVTVGFIVVGAGLLAAAFLRTDNRPSRLTRLLQGTYPLPAATPAATSSTPATPAGPEPCDGVDNNGVSGIDEGCGGPNMTLPHEYAPLEGYCDNTDNDGDGIVDDGCDADNDNYCAGLLTTPPPDSTPVASVAVCTAGGNDCLPNNARAYPGAPELCGGGAGLVDEDCDGTINEAGCVLP